MKNYLTVSASSLSTFFKCSQQYKWQFLEEREPDEGTASLYTVFGSTFHKAIELHFKFGFDKDELMSCWKVMFFSFCTETKNLQLPNKHEVQKFVDKGYEYFENFFKMKERWSKFKVLGVEQYYRLPFENKFLPSVFLSGRIDLLLTNAESIVCLDWKTSKSKEKDIEKNIQLTFYTFFINQIYKYSLDFIHGALVYPFDNDILFGQRSKDDFEELFSQINIMLERISKSDFVKEPKIKCIPNDCFFCQYTKICNKL
jgi:CRISPR/Cas system-associated exonuclease Cas4 (RecB family)